MLLYGTAFSASFQCEKSTYIDEETICNNQALSKLDDDLSHLYSILIKDIDLKKDQLSWMNARRGCRDSVTCIKNSYINRYKELTSIKLMFDIEISEDDKSICRYFKSVYETASRQCINNAEECLDLTVGKTKEFVSGRLKTFDLARDWRWKKRSVNFTDSKIEAVYYFYEKFNGDRQWRTIETWVVPSEKFGKLKYYDMDNLPEFGFKIANTFVMLYSWENRHYSAVGHYNIKSEYGGYYKTQGIKYLEVKRVYSNAKPESSCIFGYKVE